MISLCIISQLHCTEKASSKKLQKLTCNWTSVSFIVVRTRNPSRLRGLAHSLDLKLVHSHTVSLHLLSKKVFSVRTSSRATRDSTTVRNQHWELAVFSAHVQFELLRLPTSEKLRQSCRWACLECWYRYQQRQLPQTVERHAESFGFIPSPPPSHA